MTSEYLNIYLIAKSLNIKHAASRMHLQYGWTVGTISFDVGDKLIMMKENIGI